MAKAKKENKEISANQESDSRVFTFRASGEMMEFLDGLKDRSKVIKDCLETVMIQTKRLEKLGIVYSAQSMKPLRVAFFSDIRVACGFPVPLNTDERSEDIDLLTMLCPHPEATYLIRVKGDSMIDANIFDGDIVVVDKSNRYPSENQVAVCELNGEYTMKYFRHRGNEGWLVPANPDYPEVHVTEADEFNIWGIVTYVIHRV